MEKKNRTGTDALWAWGSDAKAARVLHTMIRVRNVDASLRFYCDGLGMTLLDRYDFEQGRFSILFLSYGDYDDGGALELTYNWDTENDYSHGSGYGHVAIGVPDIDDVYKRLESYGGELMKPPKTIMDGAPALAFVKDPDGYQIELIETRRGHRPT